MLDRPHRQVVFTIPKMLRIFFKYNRSLLSSLCLCGREALVKYLKATTRKEIAPGIIAVIQSFGSRMNFHPHLHFLVTEGGTDKQGRFHKVSSFNDSLLCRFFTREVFFASSSQTVDQPGPRRKDIAMAAYRIQCAQ